MAAVKGDVGQVKFDDGGSSVNPVLGTIMVYVYHQRYSRNNCTR